MGSRGAIPDATTPARSLLLLSHLHSQVRILGLVTLKWASSESVSAGGRDMATWGWVVWRR
jgi:hypothetical protein